MTKRIEQDAELARLRARVESSRAQLGASVEALTAKLDVPARVRGAAARRVEPVRRLATDAVALGAAAAGTVWDVARGGLGLGWSVVGWTAGGVTTVAGQVTAPAARLAGDLRRRLTAVDHPPADLTSVDLEQSPRAS